MFDWTDYEEIGKECGLKLGFRMVSDDRGTGSLARGRIWSPTSPHFHIIMNKLPGMRKTAQTRILVLDLEAKTLLQYYIISEVKLPV